jgi:hypothetical protein
MNDFSDFLFARPSFLEGMARVVDLGGTLQMYNSSLTGYDADAIALQMDAEAIGSDLRFALITGAEEYGVEIDEDE